MVFGRRRLDPDIPILLLIYTALYNALIFLGHGIPYVMDNNETFSALNHAYNLWHFDFFKSYGLTDEAMSPDPAAHPVVHTHQGNFPRLFATLLFALGARSAESQIWLTTMTIGAVSVSMAYVYFRKLAGRLFAGIAMAVLLTDYLMFAQWQVNTYRVWHGFFVFGALLCVHGLGKWSTRYWLAGTMGIFAGLFYGELVFAAFLAGMTGLYAAWVHRRTPKAILFAWGAQAAGIALGLGVLITQLVFYMGWDAFLTDIRLTITARNYSPESVAFFESLRQFYNDRNIVFLYNVAPEARHSGLLVSTGVFFRYVLQPYSPVIVLAALGLGAASYLAPLRSPSFGTIFPSQTERAAARLCLVPGLLLACLTLVLGGGAVLGERPRLPEIGLLASLLVVTATICAVFLASHALSSFAARLSARGTCPDLKRHGIAGLFMFGFALVMVLQSLFYDQGAKPLWLDTLTPFPVWLAKLAILVVILLGALLILCGRFTLLGSWARTPAALAPFLICGAISYAAIYKLTGGYVVSGYLSRLCPFLVFQVDAFLALALLVVIAAAVTLLTRPKHSAYGRLLQIGGGATASFAALLAAGWIGLQWNAFRALPPDQIAFVKRFESLSLSGDGILSNTYAVPFGLVTKTWAYMDHYFWERLTRHKRILSSAQLPYIWMADRRANPDYQQPALYVCFAAAWTLDEIVALKFGGEPQRQPCSPKSLRLDTFGEHAVTVIARDEAHDHWAILALNWASADFKAVKATPPSRGD